MGWLSRFAPMEACAAESLEQKAVLLVVPGVKDTLSSRVESYQLRMQDHRRQPQPKVNRRYLRARPYPLLRVQPVMSQPSLPVYREQHRAQRPQIQVPQWEE